LAKLGLMGGTFNPIHLAHLKMAHLAMEQFSLDQVLFMTGGNPPHKTTDTDAKIRHHMVKLALQNEPDFIPCDIEVVRSEPSYTANTLERLQKQYPEDAIYFIIGGDSFRDFFSWYQPERILEQCVLLVYPREGYPEQEQIDAVCTEYHAQIKLLHAPETHISSTDLRRMVSSGQDISAFVPEPVVSYIRRCGLYLPVVTEPEQELERMLSPGRYLHSLGVAETAKKMAELFGENPERAYLTGLLHDCAKNMETELLYQLCEDFEIELDEIEQKTPGLIHPKVGAEVAKIRFGITDEEMLEAIRWHTLGKVGMGALSKIIFVADMIEPNRSYPEVEVLRAFAFSDLDRAVYECAAATISFNRERGKTVHPNAYEIYKWLGWGG